MKKYQPTYLPYDEDYNSEKEEPLFETEDEAWKYIHKEYCQCNNKITFNNEDYCISCEAEWDVYVVEIK